MAIAATFSRADEKVLPADRPRIACDAMDDHVDDLVPADQRAEAEQLLHEMKAAESEDLAAMRKAFGPVSPLPEIAVTFYTMAGCWSLALAINERTGLPIEVYYRAGRPRHAYVVDGELAVDANGTNPLRLVRAGAESTRRVTPAELDELLATETPGGQDTVAVVHQAAWVEAAARAADAVLGSRRSGSREREGNDS